MNRLTKLFSEKKSNILNIYFTAGFPELNDTGKIIETLAESGADLIELGMPYSDPLADGTTIQDSSSIALKNGMELDTLFKQVTEIRKTVDIPIMLMGYFNQVMQFGETKFFDNCVNAGIDGLIIPDLPMDYYQIHIQSLLEERDIKMTFLVTPQTSDERIKQADKLSSAFLYIVAKSSITGKTTDISNNQLNYFDRLKAMNLTAPQLIGFGIHDKTSFDQACKFANGAIIGSEFIRLLKREGLSGIKEFIESIK